MFKECSFCKQGWITRDSFINDPEIVIIGYQADLKILEKGLYLFNHEGSGCGTTIACYVADFIDLFSGEFYQENMFKKEGCPGFCLDRTNTGTCSMECRNSYPRRLLQIIKEMRK